MSNWQGSRGWQSGSSKGKKLKGKRRKECERWRRSVGESTEGAHMNAEGAVASEDSSVGMGFTSAGSASGKLRRKSASKNTIK